MKQMLSASERLRNERVRELMLNRNINNPTKLPEKLTQQQMFEVKDLMRQGANRENAIKQVLWKHRNTK